MTDTKKKHDTDKTNKEKDITLEQDSENGTDAKQHTSVDNEKDTHENAGETEQQTESSENGEQAEVDVVTKEEYDNLQEKYEEINEKYLRLAAEFENFKKRTEREFTRRVQFANKELVRDILPVLDDLERARHSTKEESSFEKLQDGVDLVYNNFINILKRRGVEPIESVGEEFDPELHEAMMVQENEDYESGKVIREFERGYKIGDSVIRHAKVVVSK